MTAGKARNKKAPAPVAPSKKRTSASNSARRELARREAELREQLRASQPMLQRLDEQLKQALRDIEVAKQQGQELLKLGDLSRQEASARFAADPPSLDAVLWVIELAKRAGTSATTSANAKKRNEVARAIVCKAWDDRTDIGQSKASFGRQWSARLRVEYGIMVEPRTISTRWLKGR